MMKTMMHFPLLVLFTMTTVTVSSPLNKISSTKKQLEKYVSDTLKTTLDEINNQLISWREYSRQKREFSGVLHHNVKRDVKVSMETYNNTIANVTVNATATEEPDKTFEDYEKTFLINQTMNLLKQLLLYKEYTKSLKTNNNKMTSVSTLTPQMVTLTPSVLISTTTDGNRVDAILERKLRELNQMSVLQLDQVFHHIRNAAQRGSEDISISSLCCPL